MDYRIADGPESLMFQLHTHRCAGCPTSRHSTHNFLYQNTLHRDNPAQLDHHLLIRMCDVLPKGTHTHYPWTPLRSTRHAVLCYSMYSLHRTRSNRHPGGLVCCRCPQALQFSALACRKRAFSRISGSCLPLLFALFSIP